MSIKFLFDSDLHQIVGGRGGGHGGGGGGGGAVIVTKGVPSIDATLDPLNGVPHNIQRVNSNGKSIPLPPDLLQAAIIFPN
jgi:hypothetical protein